MLFQTDEKSPFPSREWGFFVGYYPQRSLIIKLFLLCHLVLFELSISAQNNIVSEEKQSVWIEQVQASTALSHAWIGATMTDSTSQVWFRRTYIHAQRPNRAWLNVATTGYIEVYVNGYNVLKSKRWPYRMQPNDDQPLYASLDVSRFLQADSNTIAVWFSPAFPHLQAQQIAISYYGEQADGTPFSFVSDDSWLTRHANVALTKDYSEIFHAPSPEEQQWNTNECALALWQSALPSKSYHTQSERNLAPIRASECITHILQPSYLVAQGDTVCFTFPQAFYGYARVTFRHARPQQWVNINGLHYLCSGETDEQAYRKFTLQPIYCLWITGDSAFKPEQIEKVEGIEVCPTWSYKWHD